MYYGMCQLQAIMSGAVLVRNLGEPRRWKKNFQTRSKMGTIAYTEYIPQHKGFHDLHKWTCGFIQHARGFCTMGMWIFKQ